MAWTTATDRINKIDMVVFGEGRAGDIVCRAGAYDFYIVIKLKARDINGTLSALDVSGVSGAGGSITLVLMTPNGQRSRKTLSLRSGGADGLVQYLVASGDLDEQGPWMFYVEVDWDGSSLTQTNAGLLHSEGSNYIGPEKKKSGDRWNVTMHDASAAAGDLVLYLQNDRFGSDFIVDVIIVGGVNDALWKVFYVTGTASGGSALTPTSMTSSTDDDSEITARGSGAISGLTPGNQIAAKRTEANTDGAIPVGVRLETGHAIALEYDTGTTGIAEATMMGHHE